MTDRTIVDTLPSDQASVAAHPGNAPARAISWVHIGDLHLDEADGWESLDRLRAIVAQIEARLRDRVDFVYLPGDNANHGTPDQYRAMVDALAGLTLPWRVIPGDHDIEPGDLAAYDAIIPEANRPEQEVIAAHRCVFLDVVSAGAGGPDFRLTMHDRNRIAEQLTRAAAEGQTPLVFMHAYPGDLAADGDVVARTFIDGGVAFVDTGHTHYNELLNDGRVIYGATRSTGQIEEDGGRAGFAIVSIYDGVPSWRFRTLDAAWPHVQIVAPCDRRLVTRPADHAQVPRPGRVTIVARVDGGADDTVDETGVTLEHPDTSVAMTRGADGLWRGDVELPAGMHTLSVTSAGAIDTIDLLVRDVDAIPKRRLATSPGQDCHAIGSWPIAGIDGAQLGPNKNGRGW
ncbi:metallophosphoesterase [uncultured Sphingomonas sp.]|mgnify:FL=1|uniref:metallophosphoesterase family protein n=1 Tax=uncultured Sphingomonas sp. TaxID=158754 RepID=UPI0026143D4E|nr:metallophosphoesterase [uncultured Sphingomonas sp.]